MNKKILGLIVGFFLTLSNAAHADVTLHALISAGGVLQQGIEVPVWGTAKEGEKVTVKFQDQEVSTVAKDGRWLVKLKALKAGGPFTMTIAGSNVIEIKDLLVGEVWICSGQSNMGWQLCQAANAQEEMAQANYPNIRFFIVPNRVGGEPMSEMTGHWVTCGPKSSAGFSAVGYFFGRELYKTLNVPVGLILSSWGGTTAEAWTSASFLEAEPSLKSFVVQAKASDQPFLANQKAYEAKLEEWKEDNDKIVADGLSPLPKPKPPHNPALGPERASGLYNGMIAPLVPYAFQGVIWYQGESNAGNARQYRVLFPTLIKSWRAAWQREFPFLYVQLANFMGASDAPEESAWAELREAQTMTLVLPKTAMAVAIDIGEGGSIHPLDKQDVGHRLALAAEGTIYGKSIEYSGPLYKSMETQGDRIILRFTHGEGLTAKDGDKLKGFAIAGDDKKFVWADAKIDGDTVVVTSGTVANPVAVRYAWANNPVCNLYNKAGLPASPFRTDQW